MNTTARTSPALPESVATAFTSLAGDMKKRNAYMAALKALGWSYQSISDSSKITRERVRQIVREWSQDNTQGLGSLPLPEAPKKVRKVRTPRVFIEPDPDKLARMLELQPAAQSVRSNSDKFREEAEEYTSLLAESHLDDGVTLYRLAKRLGVTHGALRFRLARYGYKLPKTATSKVYKPILSENRFGSGQG